MTEIKMRGKGGRERDTEGGQRVVIKSMDFAVKLCRSKSWFSTLSSCVILGKSFNRSVPQSSHLEIGANNNNTDLIGLLRGLTRGLNYIKRLEKGLVLSKQLIKSSHYF